MKPLTYILGAVTGKDGKLSGSKCIAYALLLGFIRYMERPNCAADPQVCQCFVLAICLTYGIIKAGNYFTDKLNTTPNEQREN